MFPKFNKLKDSKEVRREDLPATPYSNIKQVIQRVQQMKGRWPLFIIVSMESQKTKSIKSYL